VSIATAIKTVDRRHASFDRDKAELRAEIFRLSEAGVSATNIATLTGLSDRQVVRIRNGHVVQQKPPTRYQFDCSEERATHLEKVARSVMDLACRLRDEDPQLVWEALELLDRSDLQELAVTALAALPVDSEISELFGWVEGLS
jgi:hypothetical protein